MNIEKVQSKDSHGYTSLIEAAYKCDNATLKALLSTGLYDSAELNRSNDYGETALMWSACNNNLMAVKLLIGTGKYDMHMLNAHDKDGNSALMYAVHNKNLEMVSLILNANGHFSQDALEFKNAADSSAYSYALRIGGKMASLLNAAKDSAIADLHPKVGIIHSDMPILARGH
jgi:ankyrin repeat protein